MFTQTTPSFTLITHIGVSPGMRYGSWKESKLLEMDAASKYFFGEAYKNLQISAGFRFLLRIARYDSQDCVLWWYLDR